MVIFRETDISVYLGCYVLNSLTLQYYLTAYKLFQIVLSWFEYFGV